MSAHKRTPEKLAADFWGRIEKTQGGCWNWTGHKRRRGYGCFYANGKGWSATRYMWEVVDGRGTVSSKLHLCHRCDNPSCVNPEHLFVGTPQDNVDDAILKNRRRYARGEHSGGSKLTEAAARAILAEALAGIPYKQIGLRYGIGHQHVSQIKNRRRWAHLHELRPLNLTKPERKETIESVA